MKERLIIAKNINSLGMLTEYARTLAKTAVLAAVDRAENFASANLVATAPEVNARKSIP
jgi:hypothetical protein